MIPERWRQLEALYHAALARPANERPAFLAEVCAGDKGLRRELESLLDSPTTAAGFLSAPALAMAAQMVSDPAESLLSDRQLGVYRLMERIGSGGMGDVYRARDTRLGRDVAIKILPLKFTAHVERLARFEREARVLASLNHPNIATIHGVEESDGMQAIVMELVQGETLAQRIFHGPIPIASALDIARQMAKALESAHDKSIVHRDLKPANVKITPDGTVKVLDFGLAKLDAEALELPTQAPTITIDGTHEGRILGTAAYMSPEQSRGHPVDKRTDIWAFGCVLFEILSGRAAFAAETMSDTLARVLGGQPDWNALPASTPPAIRRLLQRCLERDQERRLHDIADARIEIDDELAAPQTASGLAAQLTPNKAVYPFRKLRLGTVVALVVILAVAALGAWYSRTTSPASHPLAFVIAPPAGRSILAPVDDGLPLAVAPNGQRVTFVAAEPNGTRLLWVRSLDSIAAMPLAGTQGASSPFWSPNGRSIGFFADGKLKRIEASGGTALTLADASVRGGGTWSDQDVILFPGGTGNGLQRISAQGGNPTPVTMLAPGEIQHRSPYFLPDGHHFLYGVVPTGKRQIYIGSLDSANGTELLNADSTNVAYSLNHIFFLRQRTLMAQAFDPVGLDLSGTPFVVVEGVQVSSDSGSPEFGVFAVSREGLLAFQPASAATNSQLTWSDRTGRILGTVGPLAQFRNPRLSPDGRRIAVERLVEGSSTFNRDIWLIELARPVLERFTFDAAEEAAPVWSPDGTHVAFTNMTTGKLYYKALGVVGDGRPVSDSFIGGVLDDWLPDTKELLYHTARPQSAILTLPLDTKGGPHPVVRAAENFQVTHGRVSPDGRWIAYTSDESGTWEVYIQELRTSAGRRRVSTEGGLQPVWRRDGRELYYLGLDRKLMAVRVATTPTLELDAPFALFDTRVQLRIGGSWHEYDVTPDGDRFLLNEPIEAASLQTFNVILNWPALLAKQSPRAALFLSR